ncbi:hypothetical protein BCY91_11020 [Pelobium manganitolerans]|uniref:beta-N-acetylhexosaminidase n=1 Tax=Pelobium manganitolerans TaxID=1842495 RepID=A0A419S224_9SPHI|nr:family 20 glycosylhydrolase [Pelobium manganitolerans]RKD12776.1 hypothetical protein BCY91_11020 [Pelobium manganitolerans]
MLRILFLLLLTSATCFAQDIDVSKLKVSWQVTGVEEDEAKIHALLTIINQSTQTLPASGWKLYLNYGRTVYHTPKTVVWESINGDLNRIIPQQRFVPLAPGEKVEIPYTASGRAINFRDAPGGFYLVWDNNPTMGFPLEEITVLPLNEAFYTKHLLPEDIYRRNLGITKLPADSISKIFPTPRHIAMGKGIFKLNYKTSIVADVAFNAERDLLQQELQNIFGLKPSFTNKNAKNSIRLVKQDTLKPEAYLLNITRDGISISASSNVGVFYGIQSLKSLIPAQAFVGKQQVVKLPFLKVSDSPRFGYRAFMLDVARNFHPKEEVKKLLDVMALYKLNVFHFHLNDDEGWRLEIPGLPELTQVGAQRGHTADNLNSLPPSYASGPSINKLPGSGFYSKADFMDILKYATQRHIQVIPEIETPGHARAAIKSMESRYKRLMLSDAKEEAEKYLLTDLQDSSVYRSVQKWTDNVINVALPSTYNFIEKVIDEVVEIYKEAEAPLKTIHMGGDEVPAGVWEKSPAVVTLLESDATMQSVDDLWYYFYGKVNAILQKRDLYLSGWEEVALRKTKLDGRLRYIPNPQFVDENFHAYVWNNLGGADLAYRLANAGYKTVLAPATNFYLDMAAYPDFDELGTYWAAFSDLDGPFKFVPFDYYKTSFGTTNNFNTDLGSNHRLTDFGKSNIVGLQALIWSENVRSNEQVEYLFAPRILSFAERAWAADPNWAAEPDSVKANRAYLNDWNKFVNRIGQKELPFLDQYTGGFLYRIPKPGAIVKDGKVHANVQIPSMKIVYTVNGDIPTYSDQEYHEPIKERGIIKLRVFNAQGRGSQTVTISN